MRSCGSLPQDRLRVEFEMLAGRRDRRAEDVEGHDQVLALAAVVDLADRDVVLDLHADQSAGAELRGLLVHARERHLARRVDALREVDELLVGLIALPAGRRPARLLRRHDVEDRRAGHHADRAVAAAPQQRVVGQREIGEDRRVASLRQMHGGAVDDDLDLVVEEVVAVALERDVDDGVAAGQLGLLLEPAERERARVVPGVGQRAQLGQRALAPARAPREALPADLVDRAAHHLADGAHPIKPGEREVGDREAGRERGLAARELEHPLLGGERDAAGLDARDVRLHGRVIAIVAAAQDAVEEAHSAHQPLECRARLGAARRQLAQLAGEAADPGLDRQVLALDHDSADLLRPRAAPVALERVAELAEPHLDRVHDPLAREEALGAAAHLGLARERVLELARQHLDVGGEIGAVGPEARRVEVKGVLGHRRPSVATPRYVSVRCEDVRYVTCVTRLVPETSTGSRPTSPTPVHRFSPRPSTTGAMWSRSSSIRPAFRYCRTVAAPPAIETSPSPAASRARSSAASGPSVTKWKVVPPSMVSGSRAWCVSTNTGAWYGGSSPHQPFQSRSHSPRPGLNMLRPMMKASAAVILASTALCASASASIHLVRRPSSPSPNGLSRRWFGPAVKPSREIARSLVTLLMVSGRSRA